MHFPTLAAFAAAVATAQATYIGFNYGSTFTDSSAKQQSDFEAEFNAAKALAGTNGDFTSARLYTMIQAGTTNTPISAIPAAIKTKTSLLLGLWSSAGQDAITNEIAALKSAIEQYGSDFVDLIAGISVGSEDLYRDSVTGMENDSGIGAGPDVIVSYIKQVRSAISGTAASGITLGHVDTWNAWVNGSVSEVIDNCDWVGVDEYPYFQNTEANSIDVSNTLFYDAYDKVQAVVGSKEVWVTEAGWPVSGKQENQAVASTENAEKFWKKTGCSLFGKINTWWYILDDSLPSTPSPSFGILASLNGEPLYDLTCSNTTSSSSSSSSASSTKSAASSTKSAASSTKSGVSSVVGIATGSASATSSTTSSNATVSAVAAPYPVSSGFSSAYSVAPSGTGYTWPGTGYAPSGTGYAPSGTGYAPIASGTAGISTSSIPATATSTGAAASSSAPFTGSATTIQAGSLLGAAAALVAFFL